ncbi:MAG TPA: hypothetical protein PLD02_10795, partial [Saprospiraceae bacterium]|nr:hypothetical protein [Saprospiraceae bacterium]
PHNWHVSNLIFYVSNPCLSHTDPYNKFLHSHTNSSRVHTNKPLTLKRYEHQFVLQNTTMNQQIKD